MRCFTVECFHFLSAPFIDGIDFFHRPAVPGHNAGCTRLCGDNSCFLFSGMFALNLV